jgi:hypothetical protein
MAMFRSSVRESAFLTAEETRTSRKCKLHDERLDNAIRSHSAMGAAAKYPAGADLCKSPSRRLAE